MMNSFGFLNFIKTKLDNENNNFNEQDFCFLMSDYIF